MEERCGQPCSKSHLLIVLLSSVLLRFREVGKIEWAYEV